MQNNSNYTTQDLFKEIEELLKVVQEHKGPIAMTPDLLADINKLEALATNFKQSGEELFELLDMDMDGLKEKILKSPEVRSSDKQLIKQAEDIEQKAQVMRLALESGKKERQKTRNQNDKQQMKERRKLFKSIGGDKNWLPL